MAHPKRETLVRRLKRQLPNFTTVTWDEKNDRWDTGSRAIGSFDPNKTHHLVLQDDAILPHRFMTGLENAMVRVPPLAPLVLFTTRSAIWRPLLDIIPRGTSYLIMDRIWWGVGIVYPSALIPSLLSYCDRGTSSQYDHRVGDYFAFRRIPVYYTWPNLVNHHPGPSLILGRSGRRRAQNFVRIPADRVDWSGGKVKVYPPREVELKL